MDIGSVISGILSQYNIYVVVLAVCGCSIGILSIITLVSIIKELRTEEDHVFPPEDQTQVEEGEGVFGNVEGRVERVNVPSAVEKVRPRPTIGQPERGEKVGIINAVKQSINTAKPGINTAKPGVNAALARSIAEKAQSARRAQPGNNSNVEVVPGIMVKTRTLSNLEDAKAVIQRKMNQKGQEERLKSRDEDEIADAMIITPEKIEARLENETFSGIPISDKGEEARNNAIGTSEGAYVPTTSIMDEGEGGSASIKADGIRISEIDVKSLNTEFVELKESLVLLKTKLKDIEQKRKTHN